MKQFRKMLVLTFVLMGLRAYGADEPPSLKQLGLKGTIRSVTESDLADSISPSEPKGIAFHVRTIHYSPDGLPLSSEDYVSTCERSYFAWQGGHLAEERHESENGLPERTVNFIWDADGRLREEQHEEGEIHCRKLYEYEGSTEQETSTCFGTRVKRRIKMHDEETNSDNVFVFHYQEDKKDFKLVSQFRQKTIRLEKGTIRTESTFSGGTTSVTRDSEDRLLEEVSNFGTSFHRETHRYDGNGREIEKAEWNKDGSIINRRTYIYFTDPLGNWIRRTELFWSSAMEEPVEGDVTVRAIDYY
jgi:hypothetical protein